MARNDNIFFYQRANDAIKKLDEYDFTELLEFCFDKGIQELHDVVEFLYDENEEQAKEAFDELGEYEIADYLEDRYKVWFEEITTHYMFKGKFNV